MISITECEAISKYILEYLDNNSKTVKISESELTQTAEKVANHLYNSVLKDKFELVYQPKFESDEKTTKSAEVLFRTKESVFIRPDVAFQLFKEYGFEKEVLHKQLERVGKDLSMFTASFGNDYQVSINVAISVLDKDFCKKLDSVLNKNGLQYNNIQIEILETENFDELKNHKEVISFLKSKGVKFAIDDYGSRNADKTVFDKMTFDVVKIDMNITKHANKINDYAEIEKIYNEAKEHNPNVTVVVEGVEDSRDTTKLKAIGKMTYQGYKFSKPIPAMDVVENFSPNSMGMN